MASDVRTVSIHEVIHAEWRTLKEWAKKTFAKEEIAEIAVAAAAVSVLAYVVRFLYQVAQRY